jgi:hypothetical protein
MNKIQDKESKIHEVNSMLSEMRARERGYVEIIEGLRRDLKLFSQKTPELQISPQRTSRG